MGATTLNEETMHARVGDEEEKPQGGYIRCQHAVMALDMPCKTRGRCELWEFHKELVAN